MRSLLKNLRSLTALKWGLMSASLFWLAVYRLSQTAERLPDFVYVKF